jgi:hypothetical protein
MIKSRKMRWMRYVIHKEEEDEDIQGFGGET